MNFILKFACDNAAFEGENLLFELARILKKTAAKVEAGEREGRVMDINGNTVGDFRLE